MSIEFLFHRTNLGGVFILNLLNKFHYKRYCNGQIGILVTLCPDHLADCIENGHIRKIEFTSGNIYGCKFIDRQPLDNYGDLYKGIYLITEDIQKLSFEQFNSLKIGHKLKKVNPYWRTDKQRKR